MNELIVCGYNCYFNAITQEVGIQTLSVGFYYKKSNMYIGPFESITAVEEDKILSKVADNILYFDLAY